MDKIKFLQINLQHCRAATNQLVAVATDLKIDVILAQELYVVRGSAVGIPTNWLTFLSENKNSGVSILNNNINALEVHRGPNSTFVSIDCMDVDLIIGSQYSAPSGDLEADFDDWRMKLQFCNLLLGGDFNAKNALWGCSRHDDRGEKILDLCITNNLTVLNNPSQPPTYYMLQQIGYPDLMLISGQLRHLVQNWEVSEQIHRSSLQAIIVTSSMT